MLALVPPTVAQVVATEYGESSPTARAQYAWWGSSAWDSFAGDWFTLIAAVRRLDAPLGDALEDVVAEAISTAIVYGAREALPY